MAPTRPAEAEKRGRGRPKKNSGNEPSKTKYTQEPSSQSKKGKHEQRASKVTAKKPASQSKASERASQTDAEHIGRPRGRKRKAQDAEVDELAEEAPRPVAHRGRKRKSKEADTDELDEASPATRPTRSYAQLSPQTKRIGHEVLQGWPEASSQTLEQIGLVLKRAKDEVAYSRRDPRRADEAQATLTVAVRQLERGLTTMKVPPHTKALHFDLNVLAKNNDHAYHGVTTARHAKQLLEQQVDDAQRRLEAEQESVNRLKKNTQQWKSRWKSQEKKQLHPLLEQTGDIEISDDRPEDIGLKRTKQVDTSLLDAPEPELASVLERLRRSLETIQGNHALAEGVSLAMRQAQVALDEVLLKHASAQQYDAL